MDSLGVARDVAGRIPPSTAATGAQRELGLSSGSVSFGRPALRIGYGALHATCIVTAASIAALHCWLHRTQFVNLDGISYIEIARDYARGDIAHALNGYWSPLYSWVLAIAWLAAKPSAAAEYPLVHGVNFVLFLVCMWSFDRLLSQIIAHAARPPDERGLSAAGWLLVGYSLFTWSSIVLLVVWMESPDVLAAACVYAAASALVRIRFDGSSLRTFAGLGISLGLGYLAKTAVLLLAPGIIGLAFAIDPGRRKRAAAIAAGTLMLVAMPYVGALSWQKGRFTYGDAGVLNYVWFVNHSADWPRRWPIHWPHWDGDPRTGSATHPARRLFQTPAVYEFGSPIAGTYPMWRDPSYWNEGVAPAFDWRDQIRRIRLSAIACYELLALNPYNPEVFNPQPAIAVLVFAFGYMARSRWRGRVFAPLWVLILPAVAAVVMYAAVYVEPRYLGAFIALFWLGIIAGVRFGTAHARAAAAAALSMTFMAAVLVATIVEAWPAFQRWRWAEPSPTSYDTARSFAGAGFRSGDAVAVVGSGQIASRWAHLAGLRIVAEIPPADVASFWDSAPAVQDEIVEALRTTDARAIVAELGPGQPRPPRWERVTGTGYVMFALK